jgi:quinol monooxygenase YgiN
VAAKLLGLGSRAKEKEAGTMTEPIVFVSHFRIKEDKLDGLKQLSKEVLERLEADKPRTTAQLAYLNDSGTNMSFVHVFSDANAMDFHFEEAEERSGAAYEFMDPAGWEIYGTPNDAALQMMRQAARSAGVTLTVQSEFLGGFLRTQSA